MGRSSRSRALRRAGSQQPVSAPPLPYEDAGDLARQLIAAAALDDDEARLGELAGTAALDKRVAGTVIGILAVTAARLGAEIAERDAG